jgi:hypothetical protein
MRRFLVAVFTTALVVFFSATSAFAATSGAHFMSATGSVDSTGALVVSFDESGLGNENIDYTLTSDGTATYACINGAGSHPKAANKETFNGNVSGGGTFQVKNGRVRASLSAGPLDAGGFTCPGGGSASCSRACLTATSS